MLARGILRRLAALGLSLMLSPLTVAGPLVEIWKDPDCGCCTAWAEHLEAGGFEVRLHDTREMRQVKVEQGVPPRLASCHTAVVEGYVIEGHVPAADIHRLLDEGPELAGLAVPGMPHGSPGMETGRVDDYAVYGWHADERAPEIFQRYIQQ